MTKDPYRYFRIEAQELLDGLGRGLLELERRHDPEALRRLLRLAHTLKGAARVVKQPKIAELAHAIEDLLAPLRDAETGADRATVERALSLLDRIRELADALGSGADSVEQTPATRQSSPDSSLRSVRVPLADMDTLLESVFEASQAARQTEHQCAQLGPIRRALQLALAGLDDSHDGRGDAARLGKVRLAVEEGLDALDGVERELTASAERFTREVEEVRDMANHLRLLPAAAVTEDLYRTARDAAVSMNRRVQLVAVGAETRIDATVLSILKGALRHVVLNAVAHGIESEAERLECGKPAQGTITLTIERRGERVSFRCTDDGRGLDAEAIKRAATERGLVEPAAARAMSTADVARLLLSGGVSTSAAVSTVAGRGVGLDVVRDAVVRLRGEVQLSTEPGGGTTVELTVPLSLSSLPVLVAGVPGVTVLIPLDSVHRTGRLHAEDLPVSGDTVVVDGQAVPFVSLADVFESRNVEPVDSSSRVGVVLDSNAARVALGVGALGGVRHVVVQSLPELAEVDPVVAGAAVGDDGSALPVLAPAALVERACRPDTGRGRRLPARARPAPVLVIDDSMTSRMLEQSILESAGYEVDVAASGEEALSKAREKSYGLFIVDVEMPGMSGFDFIETAHTDPDLRDVPAILVTSRSDPNDRRRGKEVGAREYIVKSEFDQRVLVQTVERLAS